MFAMGLGTPEILLIGGIVIVLFGAGALPKFARSLGKSKTEFEKGLKEGASSDNDKKVEDKKDSDKK